MQKATPAVSLRRRRITTKRMELRPATEQTLQAELDRDYPQLGMILQAEVSSAWPPPLYDDPAVQWSLQRLRESPRNAVWCSWYFLRTYPGGRRELIGVGGFKGAPKSGTVEIGYSLVEAYQRQGLGTEAAAGLVQWARAFPRIRKVAAHTLPELTASIRVLEKNGFKLRGKAEEPGAIRFELDLRPL